MRHRPAATLLILPLVLGGLLCACAAPSPAAPGSVTQPRGGDSGAPSGAPKRLVAAIMAEPPALYRALIPAGYIIQSGDVTDTIVNVGLTVTDNHGVRQPVLAEVVPSLDNGLWELFPDGQMRLTWQIRPGATWHDGVPFTAADLVFSAQVAQDPDFPEFRAQGLALLDYVEEVDSHTIATVWKQPYIHADRLFSTGADTMIPPLPQHLLQDAYQSNREGLRQLPYWTTGYVGMGPFKLQEWVAGSHLLLSAHDAYALGRPRIDQ